MRVALCLSGQPRGLKIAYEYIKRSLLDVWNPDVFVHSWAPACPSTTQGEIFELYHPVTKRYDEYFSRQYFDGYVDKYAKVAYKIDHPCFNTGHGFASIFYSNLMKREHELKSGFRYDMVVRCRFDYALNRLLPVSELEPGKVYVPQSIFHRPGGLTGNDQFAWGTSVAMDQYCNTFANLDYIYNLGAHFVGEVFLSENLRLYDLRGPNMIHVDMNDPFPAGPYNGDQHSLVRENVEEWRHGA